MKEFENSLNPIEEDDEREPVEMVSLIREKQDGKREIRIGLRYLDKGGLVPAEGWDEDEIEPVYLVSSEGRRELLTFARPIAAFRWVMAHSDLFKLVWPEPPEERQENPPEQMPLL